MRVDFFSSLCTNSMTLVSCLHGLVQNLSTRYIQMRIATEWLIPITKCKRRAVFNSAPSYLISRRFLQLPCALMILQKLPWRDREWRDNEDNWWVLQYAMTLEYDGDLELSGDLERVYAQWKMKSRAKFFGYTCVPFAAIWCCSYQWGISFCPADFPKKQQMDFQVIPTDPAVGQCIGKHRSGHQDAAIGSLQRRDRTC